MNIEEKAKAYDKALEKARQLCAYPTSKPFISDLQDLFPELKENEDERIRDLLYCLIRDRSDNGKLLEANGCSVEKALAWLEKQGEQKPVEWGVHNTKKGDILSNGTIVLVVDSLGKFEGRTIINSWYYANSEKFYGNGISECDRWEIDGFRPASEAEKNFLFKMMNKEGYMWDSEKNELVDIEKPVEWSEEDKRILSGLSGLVKDCYLNGGYALPTDEYDEYKKLLKSLKDRCLPQPKEVWCKEDEKFLGYAIKAVHNMYVGKEKSSTTDIYIKTANWLNSLNPQNRWKPNEEQIEALDDAWMSCDTPNKSKVLSELLEQLKAL